MKQTNKGIGFIVAGLVLAVVVGIFAAQSVSKAKEETLVVVAKHTIQPYTQIGPDDVKLTKMPKKALPAHAATALNQVIGTYTKTMIVKGNPIQQEQVALKGQKDLGSVLTSFNDPSIRAFALPSGNPMIKKLKPGDRVELYATVDGDDKKSTYLVAESAPVLGIAIKNNEPAGVVLALSQKEINNIVPVMDKIQIALVPYNDTNTTNGGN